MNRMRYLPLTTTDYSTGVVDFAVTWNNGGFMRFYIYF